MIKHFGIDSRTLLRRIRTGEITYGGNSKLKVYGQLKCRSGKRMKKENRVFFSSPEDALEQGYRPCAHCMKNDYLAWKNGSV